MRDLWQILVLGVTRLALDADWDRMEHMANYDGLLRQMLGVPMMPWDQPAKNFNHQTLRDNVALLDEALLKEINALVAAAGRAEFKKKDSEPCDPLVIKVDSYVLETDVHFPTDLNLLLDGGANVWTCWKNTATNSVTICRAGASSKTGNRV